MSKMNIKTLFIRTLLGAIMLVSALALVFTGMGDMFMSGPGNQIIAEIGSEKINGADFITIYRRALDQNNLPDEMARQMGVPSMVLQREIERRVLLQAAEKSGIRISDRYVATQLRQQLSEVEVPGTPQEKLKMVLNQQRITEKELVDLLRGDFAINMLASAATSGDIQVPSPLILSNYRAEREKRSGQMIPIKQTIQPNPLTESEIQAYFDEHRENYRQPEMRDMEILVLPQSLFASEITIDPQEIQAYYNDQRSRFMAPDRVRLEQLVFTDEAEANKISVSKTDSLKNLENEKAQYLDMEWFGKDTLPADFQTVLYPAKPTGILEPIKTALGWHVLNVAAYEDPKPLSLDEVSADIEKALKEEKLDNQLSEFTDELDTMIAENMSIQAIAERYKLQAVSVKNVQKNDGTKQLKDLPTSVQQRAQEAAFTLETDEISPLLDTSDGNFLLLRVSKIAPSIIPGLDQVRQAVTADAKAYQKSRNLTELSEKMIGVYDAQNPDAFQNELKGNNLVTQEIVLSTKAELEKNHGKETAELLFALTPENALSYTQSGDTVTLVLLDKIVQDNTSPDEKTQSAASETVKNNMVQEFQQQFIQAWQQHIGVNVDMTALQNTFGPQSAQTQE